MNSFFTEVILPIAIIIIVLFWSVVSMDKSIKESSCNNFAIQSNRETKFVRYNFFAYDCLTPTKEGKWISTNNLREY